MKIPLDFFKKIISDIQKHEEKENKLTDILVSKDCSGWISLSDDVINDLIKLLQIQLGDKYEYLDWWIYDANDSNKFVYESINENTECVMDLNNVEDLYYYIIGEHERVRQFTQPKQKRQEYTSTVTMEDVLESVIGDS